MQNPHRVAEDHSQDRLKLKSFAVQAGAIVSGSNYRSLDEAPKGSIAIIQLKGPVVKNSQFCGPRGTLDIAADFNRAKANPNIIGAVFVMETGGGMALAVKPLADAMQSFREEKPIVTLSGDVLASAGYYLGAYSNEIMSEHPHSIVGSIGTMMAFADIKPVLEKQGVVFHEIYATQSTLKNKTYNEALAGNYDPIIKNMLDPINEDFINDVKTQRKSKISSADKRIFAGETFRGSVALELGLIDSLGNLSAAVARVEELSKKSKPNTKIKMEKLENVEALAGVETPTEEQIELANGDLKANKIDSVILVETSFLNEAADVTTERNTLKDANTQLTADLQAANDALAAAKTANEAMLAENTTLKGKLSGRASGNINPKLGDDDTHADKSEEAKLDEELAALPHNAAIANNPLFKK